MLWLACWSTPPAIRLSNATPSVFHQHHIGRVLRSSCSVHDEELHRHAAENLAQADALLFGRVTYEMIEAAFRPPAGDGSEARLDGTLRSDDRLGKEVRRVAHH